LGVKYLIVIGGNGLIVVSGCDGGYPGNRIELPPLAIRFKDNGKKESKKRKFDCHIQQIIVSGITGKCKKGLEKKEN
jgi:hypothetical protein